jgi:hypothetical protein
MLKSLCRYIVSIKVRYNFDIRYLLAAILLNLYLTRPLRFILSDILQKIFDVEYLLFWVRSYREITSYDTYMYSDKFLEDILRCVDKFKLFMVFYPPVMVIIEPCVLFIVLYVIIYNYNMCVIYIYVQNPSVYWHKLFSIEYHVSVLKNLFNFSAVSRNSKAWNSILAFIRYPMVILFFCIVRWNISLIEHLTYGDGFNLMYDPKVRLLLERYVCATNIFANFIYFEILFFILFIIWHISYDALNFADNKTIQGFLSILSKIKEILLVFTYHLIFVELFLFYLRSIGIPC